MPTVSISRVGVLCSFNFILRLSDLVPEKLKLHFRLFVELSSVLYCNGAQRDYDSYSRIELSLVQSFLGTKVLKGLGKALASSALAKANTHELQALFLVLFGTIIAVSYSEQPRLSDTVSISSN